MGKIKLFNSFSFEKEMVKLVYTTDNFNNWLIKNDGKNSEQFIKKIHNALEGISNIPDKDVLTAQSLDSYLSIIDIFSDDIIREKAIKLILRQFKPKEIAKKSDEFDFTHFTETQVENGTIWKYKDTTIVRPITRDFFFELDEEYMPLNKETRRKFDYNDFYTDKKFAFALNTFGLTFYFANFGGEAEHKTFLFIIVPNGLNTIVLKPIRYNSLFINDTKFNDMYIISEEKPDEEEIRGLIKKYDLENILVPLPKSKKSLIDKFLIFKKYA